MANYIPKEVKKEIIDRWGVAIEPEWKAVLLLNTFSPAVNAYALYTDIGAWEVVGTGYTIGGNVITRNIWGAGATGYVDTTNAAIDAVDTAWPASTFANVRYVAIRETSGNKIRALYDFGADKTVTNGTFTVQWNSGGLIKIS